VSNRVDPVLPQHACRSSFGRSCPGPSQPIRAVASAASLAFARISVPSSVRRPPGAVRGAARCHCGGVVRTDLFVGYAGPDRPWGGVGSSAVRGGPVIGRLDLYDWDGRFQRGPEHERRTNWADQTVGLRWARFGGWKVCRIDIERMRSHVPAVPLAARTLGLVDSDSITRSSDAVPDLCGKSCRRSGVWRPSLAARLVGHCFVFRNAAQMRMRRPLA